jgi:hypothetical protein
MEHADRLRWVAEIAKINQRFNDQRTDAGNTGFGI